MFLFRKLNISFEFVEAACSLYLPHFDDDVACFSPLFLLTSSSSFFFSIFIFIVLVGDGGCVLLPSDLLLRLLLLF